MTTPNTPFYIPQTAQDALIQYFRQTVDASFNIVNLRPRFEYIDKEYIRENQLMVESTNAKAANMAGNKRKIQDIVIPIIEPQIETAHAYLTSVFLTGLPMFGVASNAANASEALQYESIISEQSLNPLNPWTRQFSKFFRHGLKYNFSALEVDWCIQKTWSIVTDTKFDPTGAKGKPQEIQWQGNTVKCLDPYNTLFDPRVDLTEQHIKGEYAGYVEMYNRVALMQKLAAMPMRMNYTKAMESTNNNEWVNRLFYIPQVFIENFNYARFTGMMDWNQWAFGGQGVRDIKVQYKSLYYVVTRYCRLVPYDFGLNVPNAKEVQIWKFITVNDRYIVYAERQTNAHGFLPIIFGQPNEDGLNMQSKSLAQKMIPFQDLGSAHANAHLAARRRAVGDRMIYDPSRISPNDINSDSPTAKIPCRPSMYGQPLEKAIYQIPFKWEETRGVMADVSEVFKFAELVSGQNKVQQGQFVKGNKTKSEFEDTMGKSSGRQQTQAILIEAQVMQPVKHIIKMNILQYQPPGKIYNRTTKAEVEINPKDLRAKAMEFTVSDGLMPSDKIIDGDTLGMLIQVLGTSEQMAEEYNVGGVVAHLVKSRGTDIDQYKWTDQEKLERHQRQLEVLKAQGEAVNKGKAKGEVQNGSQV